jgi:hypothetical protein
MITWAGLAACASDGRNACSVSVGKRKRKNRLEDLSIDGKMLLKWIKQEYGLYYSGSGHGNVEACCKQDNEPLWSTKFGVFLD